jgi:hypothetical protein
LVDGNGEMFHASRLTLPSALIAGV